MASTYGSSMSEAELAYQQKVETFSHNFKRYLSFLPSTRDLVRLWTDNDNHTEQEIKDILDGIIMNAHKQSGITIIANRDLNVILFSYLREEAVRAWRDLIVPASLRVKIDPIINPYRLPNCLASKEDVYLTPDPVPDTTDLTKDDDTASLKTSDPHGEENAFGRNLWQPTKEDYTRNTTEAMESLSTVDKRLELRRQAILAERAAHDETSDFFDPTAPITLSNNDSNNGATKKAMTASNNDGNNDEDEDDAEEGSSTTKPRGVTTTPKPARKTQRTPKPTEKKGIAHTSNDLTVYKHRHNSNVWMRDATPVDEANVPKSGPGKTVPQEAYNGRYLYEDYINIEHGELPPKYIRLSDWHVWQILKKKIGPSDRYAAWPMDFNADGGVKRERALHSWPAKQVEIDGDGNPVFKYIMFKRYYLLCSDEGKQQNIQHIYKLVNTGERANNYLYLSDIPAVQNRILGPKKLTEEPSSAKRELSKKPEALNKTATLIALTSKKTGTPIATPKKLTPPQTLVSPPTMTPSRLVNTKPNRVYPSKDANLPQMTPSRLVDTKPNRVYSAKDADLPQWRKDLMQAETASKTGDIVPAPPNDGTLQAETLRADTIRDIAASSMMAIVHANRQHAEAMDALIKHIEGTEVSLVPLRQH